MKKAHFSRSQCYEFIQLLENNNLNECIKYLDTNIKTGLHWIKYCNQFKILLISLYYSNY